MSEKPNPYEPSQLPPVRPQGRPPYPQQGPPGLSGRDSYNVVTDTVTGLNLRLRDNLLQGACILVCILIGAGLGSRGGGGAFVGGFLGMIVGVFASGIFLMIYRAIRHLRGRHD